MKDIPIASTAPVPVSQANGAASRPVAGLAPAVAPQVVAPTVATPTAISPPAELVETRDPPPPQTPNGAAAAAPAQARSFALETEATSRPVLAPRDAPGKQAAPAQRAQVGVVVALKKRSSTDNLAAAEANTTTAYSTVKTESDGAPPATPSGVHFVESPPGSAYGRLCNAGYRHLKKLNPDLRFVQFLEAGAKLDPQWIDAALKFMERRPEVAVLEGRAEAPQSAPLSATVAPPTGEAQAVGKSFLVRAEAFEAAGGFRGDLLVNETADLCIRMRRRGAHVWRIEDRMCVRPPVDVRTWWKEADEAGYAYAHGVRLHGAEPERLFVRQHIRTLAWGAAIPVLIAALALGAGVFTLITGTALNAVIVLIATLAAGAAVYAARVAVIALREGAAKRASWAYGLRVVLGQFGEFIGACRFYLSGTDPRRSAA